MNKIQRRKQLKTFINAKHAKAKYDWSTFKRSLHDEFHKDYENDTWSYSREMHSEQRLWSDFKALNLTNEAFHKGFLYIQYALMMEQREILTNGRILLSSEEETAEWHAIKKAYQICHQGVKGSMLKSISDALARYKKTGKTPNVDPHYERFLMQQGRLDLNE